MKMSVGETWQNSSAANIFHDGLWTGEIKDRFVVANLPSKLL